MILTPARFVDITGAQSRAANQRHQPQNQSKGQKWHKNISNVIQHPANLARFSPGKKAGYANTI